MAEVPKQDGAAPAVASAAASAPAKPAKPPNPVFRMMGLPNLPRKLPSRNWMIFWTVIVSFTAAKLYDNRQRKAVQKKWCDLVAHVAQEKLPVTQLPRKLTVFLAAPPGDGIGPSRTYFKQYVKPVLVAAAMDYEVIEGRKEGDVRYGTAENIRRTRRKKGEQGAVEPEMDGVMAVDLIRDRLWIQPEAGVRGDLVLGRHTWKEYIRGIHEGWLGPLDEPQQPISQEPTLQEPVHIQPVIETKTDETTETSSQPDTPPTAPDATPTEEKKEEKKKPHPPPSYLPIQAYDASPLSAYTPINLEPSQPIHQQHLLGFLKTPERIWNWLNRRKLTDEIGRQTAAIVLAQYRPYQSQESFASPSFPDDASPATRAPENDLAEDAPLRTNATYEQQSFLTEEEPYWHKSVRKPLKDGDERERVWLNDIVLDPKIAQRMRKFELDPEEEERANRIFTGQEQSRAVPVRDLTKEKPVIGSLDEDSMEP